MQAVLLVPTAEGGRALHVTESHPIPVPASHEVLIRVKLAGICGTDLEMLAGYKSLPAAQVLGHEFVGVVESFGHGIPVDQRLPAGTRVVAEINCVAPDSPSRTAAERAQDPHRSAVGIFGHPGAFAKFITVPAVNVHKVPDCISDEVAVLTEPIAAACQILVQLKLSLEAPVAVLGAGRLGWLVAFVLSECGYQVVVLSRLSKNNLKEKRRANMAECFGVIHEYIDETRMNDRFAVVVDCTGSSSGLVSAIKLVKPRGTIVLKSTTASESADTVDLTPLVVKEVALQGSRCGPFPVALRLLERTQRDLSSLIQKCYDSPMALDACSEARSNGALKVLLRFE